MKSTRCVSWTKEKAKLCRDTVDKNVLNSNIQQITEVYGVLA